MKDSSYVLGDKRFGSGYFWSTDMRRFLPLVGLPFLFMLIYAFTMNSMDTLTILLIFAIESTTFTLLILFSRMKQEIKYEHDGISIRTFLFHFSKRHFISWQDIYLVDAAVDSGCFRVFLLHGGRLTKLFAMDEDDAALLKNAILHRRDSFQKQSGLAAQIGSHSSKRGYRSLTFGNLFLLLVLSGGLIMLSIGNLFFIDADVSITKVFQNPLRFFSNGVLKPLAILSIVLAVNIALVKTISFSVSWDEQNLVLRSSYFGFKSIRTLGLKEISDVEFTIRDQYSFFTGRSLPCKGIVIKTLKEEIFFAKHVNDNAGAMIASTIKFALGHPKKGPADHPARP